MSCSKNTFLMHSAAHTWLKKVWIAGVHILPSTIWYREIAMPNFTVKIQFFTCSATLVQGLHSQNIVDLLLDFFELLLHSDY